MKTVAFAALATGLVAADYPPHPGNLTVATDSFDLGGFKCGKQETGLKIFYPQDLNTMYPIASYGHGIGGSIIDDLCEAVASLGIIVIAPMTSGGECDESDDLLHALKGTKDDTSLHKALKYADYTRSAVYGHSMGGASTVAAASKSGVVADYNLKAVVVSHDRGETTVDMPADLPAMFTTGGKDGYNAHGQVKAAYDEAPCRPKVFASYTDGEHMEPLIGGHLNRFDAHFLACYMIPLNSSCEFIYGTGPSTLCEANPMDSCEYVM